MLAATGRKPGLVVEIGGKDINGSVRPLFGEPYVAVDVRPGPGVDVVADGATYRPELSAAMVVCCEVLEHTPDGAAICANACAMLEPGGVFFLTAAGEGRAPHSAVDGGPLPEGEFYANVTRPMLEAWLAPFAAGTIAENQTTGDIYAIAVKGDA
jgi:hypothetical protein